MKKYSVLLITTVLIIGSIFAISGFYQSSVPSVEVIQPKMMVSAKSVEGSGVIEAAEKTEMKAQIPLVVDKVYIQRGDEVNIGDVIASVDDDQTVKAMASMAGKLDNIMPGILAKLGAQGGLGISEFETLPKEIVATASGIVSSLSLQEGSFVWPGEVMAAISDLSHLNVRAEIREDEILNVQVGQEADITGDALGQSHLSGKVSEIAPTATTKLEGLNMSTVVEVVISLEKVPNFVRPGYHVTLEIAVGEEEASMVLPYEVILQDDSEQEYVYCYQNGVAVRHNIVTGTERMNEVTVSSGIGIDDFIVYQPSAVKKNRQKLKVNGTVKTWNL